jgi:hypothetical protein
MLNSNWAKIVRRRCQGRYWMWKIDARDAESTRISIATHWRSSDSVICISHDYCWLMAGRQDMDVPMNQKKTYISMLWVRLFSFIFPADMILSISLVFKLKKKSRNVELPLQSFVCLRTTQKLIPIHFVNIIFKKEIGRLAIFSINQ